MYGKVTIFSFSKMVVVGLAKELFVSLKLDRNASERAHKQRAFCSSLAVSMLLCISSKDCGGTLDKSANSHYYSHSFENMAADGRKIGENWKE